MRRKRKLRWNKSKNEKKIIMMELEKREKFISGRKGEKKGRYMRRKNKDTIRVNI